jgi:hypothetical protein
MAVLVAASATIVLASTPAAVLIFATIYSRVMG